MAAKKNAIVKTDSPMQLVRDLATDPTADPEKFKALLEVQKDWESNEARKAFAAAITGFQSECPIIEPLDRGGKGVYAKLDRIHRETRTLRTKYKLAVMWAKSVLSEDQTMCHLEGMLTHGDGHSISVAYDIPIPDAITSREGKSVMNAAQRMGSATTYARRYGECAVLGIVTGKDDDGEGAGAAETISAHDVKIISLALKDCPPGTDAKVLKFAGVDTVPEIPAKKLFAILKKLNATATASTADQGQGPTQGDLDKQSQESLPI